MENYWMLWNNVETTEKRGYSSSSSSSFDPCVIELNIV